MKIVNSKLKTQNSKPSAAAPFFIKIPAAAKLFDVSESTIRQQSPPFDRLTIVVLEREGAQRRSLRLIDSEVVALKDELIQNARKRTDVNRMLSGRGSSPTVRERANLKLVVNE